MKNKTNTINNLAEFMDARGFGETEFHQVEKNTFNYTNCGAWIETHPDGIAVGSIVEGSDADCTPHYLKYPFELDEFWKALQAIEDEAEQIWVECIENKPL
tara:strand:- start:63 stop:365 length:303 start_codon:yes stop_codon:yes gene_type:complete